MAAKTQSTFINMVVVLFVVTAVAGLALGGVYNLTKEPIAIAKQKKLNDAIKAVLPEFDSIQQLMVQRADGDDSLQFYIARKDTVIIGTAVNTYTMKGFSGLIKLLVGFIPDGSIHNVSVLEHKETPGLGTKMDKPKFKDQYKGVHPAEFDLKVTKDKGDVDAITAATISSRAFSDAVQRAYDTFEKNKGGNK
ncbi:MAG: RnfABCDGE type electron transport complex subunit G [Bacteroidales bacterium]|jgi:electron transport complex protein RnfG|nr:RnfABCDGE type electron transport complex subunit G [Bacteroidales bacterium]